MTLACWPPLAASASWLSATGHVQTTTERVTTLRGWGFRMQGQGGLQLISLPRS